MKFVLDYTFNNIKKKLNKREGVLPNFFKKEYLVGLFLLVFSIILAYKVFVLCNNILAVCVSLLCYRIN